MDDDMDDAPGATGIDDAQKTGLVQAEVQRVKCLPPSSAYAIHRLKVLNKMLQLLSKVSISRPMICIILGLIFSLLGLRIMCMASLRDPL